jgi:NADPH:quinone reductase-like Zn-dependent oxidoreductase
MKALQLKRYGGMDQVDFAEVPRPTPGPGQVLIDVHAASVNPVDIKVRNGDLKSLVKLTFPSTLGNDVAGIVVEVAPGVTSLKPGDAVYASREGLRGGAFAELAVFDESAVAPKPARLDFVSAAAVPMVGLTALQAIKQRLSVRAGQKLFISSGAGGVGTFAVQVGKLLGAHVATTASAANADFVRSFGADVVIDYKKQRVEAELSGYDAVFDTLGGASLEAAFTILKPDCTVVSIAGPPDAALARSLRLNFVFVLVLGWMSRGANRSARRSGVRYSYMLMSPKREDLVELGRFIDDGKLRPVVDKVFPFSQAKEALALVENGGARGKVVLQIKP